MLPVLVRDEVGAVEQLRFQKGMGDRWGTPLPMSTTQLKRKVQTRSSISWCSKIDNQPPRGLTTSAYLSMYRHLRKKSMTWARSFSHIISSGTLLPERGIPAQSYWPDGFNILARQPHYAEKIAQLLLLY
ncbi:hypothetical protein NPIL_493931 [Nephila pilipes]|uniref:Uncharacterized protein n=1 Tax=Nephila pilipes TaxID=299642 RepID=A0A8X6QAP1_NEPPI|nr:hypothetical protein NPIL_493931 [Nephila pilipes]